jgi:hypothetical protein
MTGNQLGDFRRKIGIGQFELSQLTGFAFEDIQFHESKYKKEIPESLVAKISELWPIEIPPPNELQPDKKYHKLRHKSNYIKRCAPRQNVESPQLKEENYAMPAITSGIVKGILSVMPITYSETMLSVGDIPSACLLNTGSDSYKRLVTWLEGV